MTPPLAIAMAYGIVWVGVLLYLFRLRRRVVTAEAEVLPRGMPAPRTGETLGMR